MILAWVLATNKEAESMPSQWLFSLRNSRSKINILQARLSTKFGGIFTQNLINKFYYYLLIQFGYLLQLSNESLKFWVVLRLHYVFEEKLFYPLSEPLQALVWPLPVNQLSLSADQLPDLNADLVLSAPNLLLNLQKNIEPLLGRHFLPKRGLHLKQKLGPPGHWSLN